MRVGWIDWSRFVALHSMRGIDGVIKIAAELHSTSNITVS
jgi:hypothetical protein